MKIRILLLLVCLVIAACKDVKTETNTLGDVDMSVTGNAEAATQFEKGLLLLHSFEYFKKLRDRLE